MSSLRVWMARQFRPSDYLRNVAKLTAGTGLAQLLMLGAAPVITRLYQPGDYGLAASYAALLSVLVPIATLRYDLAVVAADDDAEAVALGWLGLGLCLVVSLAITLLFLLVSLFTPWLRQLGLGSALLLLPLSILATAANVLLSYWANRKREYGALSRSKILTSLVYVVIALGTAVLVGSHFLGLIGASICSVLAGLLLLSRVLRAHRLLPRGPKASYRQLRHVARKYRQFPQYNLGMTLLDQLTASLPVLLFASLFSPVVAAYFALANTVLRLPSGLISAAVAQVFYERAARDKHNTGQLRQLVLATVRGLASLALLPAAILIATAPLLFGLIFGSAWYEAGHFARFLAIVVATTFVVSPISTLPSVLNLQHIHLAFTIVSASTRVAGIWIGAKAGSPLLAVKIYSLGETCLLLAFLAWLIHHLSTVSRQDPPELSATDST